LLDRKLVWIGID
jgi:hypothetical protein